MGDTHKTLSGDALVELRTRGQVTIFGGVTIASLLASLNAAEIGPEDVEITGEGGSYGLHLYVVGHPANAEDEPDA